MANFNLQVNRRKKILELFPVNRKIKNQSDLFLSFINFTIEVWISTNRDLSFTFESSLLYC